MPRFSDIFTYDHSDALDWNRVSFTDCYLLKQVGPHAAQTRFDGVVFDMAGMFLFFENHKFGEELVRYGPVHLTTQ